jgi:hypothetical protein
MSEREGSHRERVATRAGRSELARTGLSEEWALSEREHRGLFGPRYEGRTGGGAWRERVATRAGRSELARTGLSEEWA